MNKTTQIARDKMINFLNSWPILDIVALDRDGLVPYRVQKVYDIMPIIDDCRRFRLRLIGKKDDKILWPEPDVAYYYPCITPGQVLNDNRVGERFVERIAWTWDIFPEDFYGWFTFVAPKH